MANTVQKFLLNDLDVRGALVNLDSAWQTVLSRHEYPPQLIDLLGEATVATLLMSTNIKYDGQLMLQLQSNSDLSLLVVQNDNNYHFRTSARYGDNLSGRLSDMATDGLIAIMVEADRGNEPYQGIVGIESDSLATNLEAYFNQSEQIRTMLILRADGECATGILLQVMPGSSVDDEQWSRLRVVAETLNVDEMKNIDSETMITRIFAEDDKTAYPVEYAYFECNCSVERTLSMLSSLDEDELADIVETGETLIVGCDFCGKKYEHDAPTIAALLSNKIHPN